MLFRSWAEAVLSAAAAADDDDKGAEGADKAVSPSPQPQLLLESELHLQAYFLQFPLPRRALADALENEADSADANANAHGDGSMQRGDLGRSAVPNGSDPLVRLIPVANTDSSRHSATIAARWTEAPLPGPPALAPGRLGAGSRGRRVAEHGALLATLARVANAAAFTAPDHHAASPQQTAAVTGLPVWLRAREPWTAVAHETVGSDAAALLARVLREKPLVAPVRTVGDASALLARCIAADKPAIKALTGAFFRALHRHSAAAATAATGAAGAGAGAGAGAEAPRARVRLWWNEPDSGGDDLGRYETDSADASANASGEPPEQHPLGFTKVRRVDGAGAAAVGAKVWRFESDAGVELVRIVLPPPERWGVAVEQASQAAQVV